jgi:hypothetical protein
MKLGSNSNFSKNDSASQCISKKKFVGKMGGQAITEFLVMGLVLIPLFFGIYYTARYADVKHAAIQASRYSAFERTWDPLRQIKSDPVLQQETRARFFTSINRNSGQLRFDDGTVNLPAASNHVALWHDARHNQLITNYSNIGITTQNRAVNLGGAVGIASNLIARPLFNLPTSELIVSQVVVPVANIAHFEPLRNLNLSLAAQAAVGGSAWNASGPRRVAGDGGASVCDRVRRAVPSNWIPAGVTNVIGILMSPFERNSPEFGLIRPDIVPIGSIRTGTQDKSSC